MLRIVRLDIKQYISIYLYIYIFILQGLEVMLK